MSSIKNLIGLNQIIVVLLLSVSSFFNISSRLSPNPCISCHRDGRYMHLHIDENPALPLPVSLVVSSTHNITVTVENFCEESENNVMTNITVTLKTRAGHTRVDKPTQVIAVLPPGSEDLTWEISGESSGTEVLEFVAIATNPHQNLTLIDSLFHDLEVVTSSIELRDTSFIVTDTREIPITNAIVRVGSVETFTDISGTVKLKLPRGNYSYIVTRFGFRSFNSSYSRQ